MNDLIPFLAIIALTALILRHRYRMKLLAAATPALDALPRGMARVAVDPDARIASLEEKLVWLERLVRESAEKPRAELASPSPVTFVGRG